LPSWEEDVGTRTPGRRGRGRVFPLSHDPFFYLVIPPPAPLQFHSPFLLLF
jgi:hypothetical protein